MGVAVAGALLVLGLIGMAGAGKKADATAPAWVSTVDKGLAKRGFKWIDIAVGDGVATVSGEAPDVDSRQYGFDAAESAIQAAAPDISVVVDATHLAGGEPSVGEALMALGAHPATTDCDTAFKGVLSGRTVNFTPGSADLTPDNKRLLDALSGVAIRCRAFAIEVGGHTDQTGSAQINRTLSQSRAQSVVAYLRGKGVPEGVLTARGYGSSRPLDAANTPEAQARNRRIEFTVAAR